MVEAATLTFEFTDVDAYRLGDGTFSRHEADAWCDAVRRARRRGGGLVAAAAASVLAAPVDQSGEPATPSRLSLAQELARHGLLHPSCRTALAAIRRLDDAAWEPVGALMRTFTPRLDVVACWVAELCDDEARALPLPVPYDPLAHRRARSVPAGPVQAMLSALAGEGLHVDTIETEPQDSEDDWEETSLVELPVVRYHLSAR